MITLIILLLLAWLVLTVIGFVVKGILWLSAIGIVLFLATALFGWFKLKK